MAHNNLKNALLSLILAIQGNSALDDICINANLSKINIRGNNIGDKGAYAIAKLLYQNSTIEEIIWDQNEVSLKGWYIFSCAVQRYALFLTLGIHLCLRAQFRLWSFPISIN